MALRLLWQREHQKEEEQSQALIIVTDFESPSRDSPAGEQLARNMQLLHRAFPRDWPRQGVDGFAIPRDLLGLSGKVLYLAGSPAGHTAENRFSTGPRSNPRIFKSEMFYSMMWQTLNPCGRQEKAVGLTFSGTGCATMEWYTHSADNRVVMVAPAWFESYKPSRGLAGKLLPLGVPGQSDCRIALALPVEMAASLRWRDGKLDVASTISSWDLKRVVTFAAYTAEMEKDISISMTAGH
jgi:hypothetical protein